MANYRDKGSQPSKLDGCANQHRYKIAKDSFYENFSLKNQFCLLYHDDDDSLDSCKLKGAINTLLKYIEDAPMKMQYSIDFAKDVRKKLLCLHYDISRFLKHNKEFPFSSELHNLLVRYVEFEHDILYHPKNFSKDYQKVVEQQVLYLLLSIFYDPIGVKKKLVSSPEEASAINSLYILKNLKPEYKKSQGLIENMMIKLLTKLNILDEINEMKRKDSDINFDKLLKVSQVQKLHKYLASRNYYDNDDFNNSDDEFGMEVENIATIKQEIKVEHNHNADIELIVSSNQQCITIDLDSDSEDCHNLDVRKNTSDLNIKRARASASLSESQLNSFSTSNICDNNRLLLNSDNSRVLNLCDNENMFSDTNRSNLSNSNNGFSHNKIQNSTRQNSVDEANSDKDTSLHMIYEDSQYENFQLKRELLLLDNDEHLCIPSKLYDITEKLKRYIDECPKSIRYTRRFVNGIHRTLIYLYESMCRLVKGNREFLSSLELHTLLVTYIELEYEVLYDSKNFSTQYEETVQSRILHLLLNMLYNPTVDGSIKQYVKSAEEASSLSTLYVVRSIKQEYKKQHPLIENIMNKLMLKLNVLDKINELKSKNKNIQLKQLLTIPQFNKIYKYLNNRDFYGMDDCNSSEDHLDMVEVKPSIKNEEIDIKPDVTAYYHLDKRKPIVIDLDEEEDDCYMISDVGIQPSKTVVKVEENSSQNLFDNVLAKVEPNSNNSDDYSVSNLCNNNQNNECIIIDSDGEEESNILLEKSNSMVACAPKIGDELEEELLQLEDAASDIESEDENEVLNRFTDDEFDTNEKINNSDFFDKSNLSNSSNRQTTTFDQQLTSEKVETSSDKSNLILVQNKVSVEVLEGTVNNSCSSIENIDTTISEKILKTNKSIDELPLTNYEINHVGETDNCSSNITVESNLIANLNKDMPDNVDISEITRTPNSSLKSATENLTIEKDITSISNIPSNIENLNLTISNVSNKNSEISVLNETNLNVKIPNKVCDIQEIHHTSSISEDNDIAFIPKNSTLNIQNVPCNSNLEIDTAYETDLNLKIVHEREKQPSASSTECTKEFDSTTDLNEQDKTDNFNLESDGNFNIGGEIQKDVNSKILILSNEEAIVQDNRLIKIDNKPPYEVVENENLHKIVNEINITSESSDLVENEVVTFQEQNVEDICENAQLLEKENSDTIDNEINTSSENPELLENEKSIIHTNFEKKDDTCERSNLFETEESIITSEYDKEVVVSVENVNSVVEKEMHVVCENSESFEGESISVHTENEQSEVIIPSNLLENAESTVSEHLFIGDTQFEVFCQPSISNENTALNAVEHLEVQAEVDVVSDDLNEELCILEDQTSQPKKETIEELQSIVVEHLEVQKASEVNSKNGEIFESEPTASKFGFNFQDNNYVKETINEERIIEDDVTEELHIEIQDPVTVDNKNCEEGLKNNATFNNHSNNLLSVLAQVASEQQKMEDSLEMENNEKKKKAVMKKKSLNKKKQNAKNKRLKRSSVAVKRVTRSSSLKAKENLDTEVDACNYIPSNFMNLENFVSPPPNRIYDLIIPNTTINEESVDGSDSDQTNQQFGVINNLAFDEDTIEDGIEFVRHMRKNKKVDTSISKSDGSVIHPIQEINSNDTCNIETNSTSHHVENVEDTSLNFQIKTSETFTHRDINNKFNVKLLLNHDEESKSLKTKSKPSANKKSKKVKSSLKCAELCVSNKEFNSCRDVKTTSNKNTRSKLELNTKKQLNKTKNQKLCSDSVSIKSKSNKFSDDEVHVPYEKTEEIIVQHEGIENITEAELEIEVITEETCESNDIQIDAEVTVADNVEVRNSIAINSDIDVSISNSLTNTNIEECLNDNIFEKIETESTTNNASQNVQKSTNIIQESENQINLNIQKNDFAPESDSKEPNAKIDNERRNLNKSSKSHHSKVKGHGKDAKKVASKEKPSERRHKGDKKNCLKVVEESIDTAITDLSLVINNSINSSKITNQNMNLQHENMKTKKQKLLKNKKYQCSSRSHITKYIGKNNLSRKLGIRKKNKHMITKKIKFLRASLKKTRDRIKKESVNNLKKEYDFKVDSNTEITKINKDNNGTEASIKNESTKKKRKGKKILQKSEFLNEENWICSPIEEELKKNEISMPSKSLEHCIEDTITKNNQEISLMKETELNASNNLQINSTLIENDHTNRVTENKELISTNSETNKIEVEENVTVNCDYEKIIESPNKIDSIENEAIEISKEDKNETIRKEDQLTESSAIEIKCITAIANANISKEPCDNIQSTVAPNESNAVTKDPDSTAPKEESSNIHEELVTDELFKNSLPSMSTLVEEIKKKKRKLSECEYVQDQEERFSTKENSVVQPKVQVSKVENKTIGKFSKRRLRSSKTDFKSKDIDSITENLRSRSYQKLNTNTTEGTKTTLENLNTVKSGLVVEIVKMDIKKINTEILKEENSEILEFDDNDTNKVEKETNTTSEITEVNDNKTNQKLEEEVNTNMEITEIDINATNQKVEKIENTTFDVTEIDFNTTNQKADKEVMLIENDDKYNQEVAKISDTTLNTSEIDINTAKQKTEIEVMLIENDDKANQEVEKIADTTLNTSELDNNTKNQKTDKEIILIETDDKSNHEVEKMPDTTLNTSEIDINTENHKVDKEVMLIENDDTSNQEVEKLADTTLNTNELDDNTENQKTDKEVMLIENDDKSNHEVEKMPDTTFNTSEIDINTAKQKTEIEVTLIENDNNSNQEVEKIPNTTFNITEIDVNTVNQKADKEINTTSEIFELDNNIRNTEIEDNSNTISEITKLNDNKSNKKIEKEAIKTSKIIEVDDNETSKELKESYATSKDLIELKSNKFIETTEISQSTKIEINTTYKSFNELEQNELMEIAEDETVTNESILEEENSISQNSNQKLVIEMGETTEKIIRDAEAIDENLIEFEEDKSMQVSNVDNNEKYEGEKETFKSANDNYIKIAEIDDVKINNKLSEELHATPKNVFPNLEITEVNSNNKINEKISEDINTTDKNVNEFEKDYLIENSEIDNSGEQFSMDIEKTSNLPTTVEEINMLGESPDNGNQNNIIEEHNLKTDENLNEDNLIDVHQDNINESGNCENVVETEKDSESDKMNMEKEISKECDNVDRQECKDVTEVKKDFAFNDFEFSKKLNKNVTDIEIQSTKNFISSSIEPLNTSAKVDYSVTTESEYTIEEVTIQSSILSPKNLQHIVDSVKNIPSTEILEEIVDCHGLLNSKGFQDSILAYSEEMKETMDSNCLLQIANETIVETSQVTPSTSLSDNCETSSNFLQAMFSHQSSETVFIYLEGSDHNYHSVRDPLMSAKYGATDENDRSLNQVKEIPTPELETEDNIMQFISTQSEGNLNQELSTSLTTSLNETSVNNSADFQLLDQCLMENALGHESSPPLPQRVSCDNVFQHTLKQKVDEYDENSRNSNLEFPESNEEVNIDSFQQNEMSTEKMIELMSVLADIKHLNNITSGSAPLDAEINNYYNQQYILQYPEQTQKSYEDVSTVAPGLSKDFSDVPNTSGFTNKSSTELQESPTKIIRDIFDATNSMEHADSIPISRSLSFDTDFSNIYFPGIQDTFLTRDKTSNKKVIVERIIPADSEKCTSVIDIPVVSSNNDFKVIDAHRQSNIPKISATAPKKKSLTLIDSHPKFTLKLQSKIKKSNVDNKLLLDDCLKRHSTRTQVLAPKKKQLIEVPKKSEILHAKSNSELKIETTGKVSLDKNESLTRSYNELDLRKVSSRRVSEKAKIVNDTVKDGKSCNLAITSKKEDATSKKEDESKTIKNFNKEVTSYLEDLDKLVVQNQNSPKENDKKSISKLGCTTTDSHSQTINFTISPPQQKVKDNFEQALSKNDLIDNVKSRKRKPVDYVEKSERKKNCDISKKLPYKGNQKKIELEDPINKAKGKRKLDQFDDKDAKIKNKFYEIEENKLHDISDNSLQQKEKSLEDLDDNISKKKKPRLSLSESNPMDEIFDRLRKEGNVNDVSNNSTNNYANRNPVSLPTYDHFSPIMQSADKNMINLQKSTSNSISIFNTGAQRTIDNKPKKIAIVAPIKSNVKKEPPPMCSRSLYNRSEDYHNMKGHHLHYTSSSSSKNRHYYSNRESSRSRHQEGGSSSRRREYQSDRKQPSSRTNKTSEHDWLDKMKHAFPQEFTNEVSFEYERGNDISRSTHQH